MGLLISALSKARVTRRSTIYAYICCKHVWYLAHRYISREMTPHTTNRETTLKKNKNVEAKGFGREGRLKNIYPDRDREMERDRE